MSRHVTRLLVSLLLGSACSVASAQSEIFSDDFETGDTTAWSLTTGLVEPPPCVVGQQPTSQLEGDLGPAPNLIGVDIACLEMRNDVDFPRRVETAGAGIPLSQDLAVSDADLDRLILIGPGNRRLPAQFEILSRWGGPLVDTALPVRWLHVMTQTPIAAEGTVVVALRLLTEQPPASGDVFEASITAVGEDLEVDTGVATFVLDPADPALVEQIALAALDDGVGRQIAYQRTPGSGPRMVFDTGGGSVVLDTSIPGAVSVDGGSFEIVEAGPVKVVVAVRGHFNAPSGASLCLAVQPAYERFGYTAVATFHRGRRDIDLRFQFRNECSDAEGNPFIDDGIEVAEAAWQWPFGATFSGPQTNYYGGSGGVVASSGGIGGDIAVEQRKGAGDPWQRRARVFGGGAELESGIFFERPLVAMASDAWIAAVQMPWMRYREPQSLVISGTTLAVQPISEPLVIGEAKAVWSLHRLSLQSVEQANAGGVVSWLEALRQSGQAALERGLILRADLASFNAAGVFPTLGDPEVVSPFEAYYLESIEYIHQENVRPGGQWERNKTFGSQLWPDVQFDQYATAPTPFENPVRSNYWNPLGAELWEFLRGGDPKFVWDFALPQSWHQAFAAFLNLGHRSHGNRNGLTVAGTGTGEGHWNRNGNLSSDDYNYNMGMQMAYALRPNVALRHRFDQVGLTILERYDLPQAQQGSREPFVNEIDLSRGVTQHLEHLANCAEWSPGQRGADCHARLIEIIAELVDDNASAGVFCGDDIPDFGTPCGTPQQFMMNAHIYHFFDRIYRNYGDVGPGLRQVLVDSPLALYQWGVPKLTDGVSIDLDAVWPGGMDCTLSPDGETLISCSGWTDGEPTYFQNYPHTVALLLIAHQHDPAIGLCELSKTALDQLASQRALDFYISEGAGWFKASAQVIQGLVWGIGAYELCTDP